MRRLSVFGVCTVVVVIAVASTAVPASSQVGTESPGCNEKSWVAGITEVCDGVLVYRDYVYDDYGADTSDPTAPTTGPLTRPAGDERYPEGQEATADLIDLALDAVGNSLQVTFELNALYEADSTIAALAIDTDSDASTGGGEWEGLDVSSEGWDELHLFDKGSPDTNLIEGTIGLPPGDTWRVQAVTAQSDGNVMNVAFRGPDETTATGTWWEDKQAAALANGDISEFGAEVDVADLRSGAIKPASVVTGFHERVYTSKYTIGKGEGMSYNPEFGRHGDSGEVCEQEFHYFGKYQPYGIYVPDQAAPHGMQLALHGCSAGHASLVDQPGMQEVIGEGQDRIVVVPLGRGPMGYYSDISERDALDVMADVRRNYDVDADRIFSGGYSMGGYGAYRMAMFYPHRFAGAISWVGFTGDCFNGTPRKGERECKSGAIGNVINYVKNLRHVPTAMLYAGADELVHTPSHRAMATKFKAKSPPYIYYLHPLAEHFTLAVADDWTKEAAWTSELTRVDNPGHITYRTMEWLWSPKYKIRHDRAYWIDGIRGRDRRRFIDLDVTSHACGGPEAILEEGTGAGPDPVPWQAEYRTVNGRESSSKRKVLEATLENVETFTIDGSGSCLRKTRFRYDITTDGPTRMLVTDGRSLTLSKGRNKGFLKAS